MKSARLSHQAISFALPLSSLVRTHYFGKMKWDRSSRFTDGQELWMISSVVWRGGLAGIGLNRSRWRDEPFRARIFEP